MDKKRNSLLFIIFGLLVLSIIITATYAYFQVNTSYDSTLGNVVGSLDCINISYSESDVISLTNQYPVTDEYALSHITPVTVTVTNNCASNVAGVNYTLALTSLKNSTGYIDDDQVRMHVKRTLNNDTEKIFKNNNYVDTLALLDSGVTYNYLSNELNTNILTKDYNTKTIYRIDNQTLNPGEVNTYKLYLWIDYYEGDITHSGLRDNSTQNKRYDSFISLVVNSYVNKNTDSLLLGGGTNSVPYEINSIEDLVRLSNSVYDGNTYEGKTIALLRDLDFNNPESYEDANRIDFGDINENSTVEPLITELTTGSGFRNIGQYGNKSSFLGTFKGNNKSINNVYVNRKKQGPGLFGRIGSSSIENLTITGNMAYNGTSNYSGGGLVANVIADSTVSINNVVSKVNINYNTSSSSSSYIGGLIGLVSGTGSTTVTVINSKNEGNITINSGSAAYAGGIIGSNGTNNTTISNSYNTGTIYNKTGNYTAGIVGNSGNISVNNCHNEGSITCDACRYISGILGRGENATINNSYNNGNLTVNTSSSIQVYTGGIIGFAVNVSLNNDYNSGTIQDTGDNFTAVRNVGGLIGIIQDSESKSYLTNSYNTGEIIGGSIVGGIIGRNQNSTIIDKCYNNGYVHSTAIYTEGIKYAGGIIGSNLDYSFQHGPVFITNSYNNGKIEYVQNDYNNIYTSGILGRSIGKINSNYISNIYIVNSYNVGYIKTNGYSYGVGYVEEGNVNIINVYNYGDLEDIQGNAEYSIGGITQGTQTLNYVYYNNKISSIGHINSSGSRIGTATPRSKVSFNTNGFVNELNTNITNIDLSEIDVDNEHTLDEYVTLSSWVLGKDGYPVFANASDHIWKTNSTNLYEANDLLGKMYRYEGDYNTVNNNYICFGTTDKGECTTNNDKYMYRILGITEDGTLKLIKNKALSTTHEWHNKSSEVDCANDACTWPNSTLYKDLNGNYFLKTLNKEWQNKILSVDWKYGDVDNQSGFSANGSFTIENGWNNIVKAKIGLMYIYDYYYASKWDGNQELVNDNKYNTNGWNHRLHTDNNIPNEWEYLISRYGINSEDHNYNMWNLNINGNISHGSLKNKRSVRPVFYLSSGTIILNGNGTSSNPYTIW